MTKRWLAMVMLVVAVTGCATEANYRKLLDRWIGAPEEQLVADWGVPTRTYQVGDSKFLAYAERSLASTGGSPPSCFSEKNGRTRCYPGTPSTLMEYRCETTFQIRNGAVVRWQYKGNDCVAPDPGRGG